jgi:hypothetical protein
MKGSFLVAVLLSVAGAAGCARQIGDECSLNSDCGVDKICDTSQPGGYCTISPCRADTCPSEAICVTFAPQTTWCMRVCSNQNPCRGDYRCVTDFKDFAGTEYPAFCDQSPPAFQ